MGRKKAKANLLSQFETLCNSRVSIHKLLGNSLTQRRYWAIKHHPDKEGLIDKVFKHCVILIFLLKVSPTARERIFSMQEFRLEDKWTTFLDKLNFYERGSMLAMSLLKILVQELTSKDRALKPFWTPAYKELSEKLLLPTGTGCQDLGLNCLSTLSQEQVALSPFSTVTKLNLPNVNSPQIYSQSSISSIVDKWENEATKKDKFRTIRIKIYPTLQQQQKLQQILDTTRFVYNRSLEYVKKEGYDANFQTLRDMLATERTKKFYFINKCYGMVIDALKEKIRNTKDRGEKEKLQALLRVEQKDLKEELKHYPYIKNPLIHDFELEVSNEIRSNAIQKLCDAYESARSNFRNGNIKHFNMSFLKKNNWKQCAELSPTDISIVDGRFKLCPQRFGEHKYIKMGKKNSKRYGHLGIKHNCDLIKHGFNFYIHVSVPISHKNIDGIEKICGVDPGLRKFATVYSQDAVQVIHYPKHSIQKLNNQLDMLKAYKGIRKCAFAKREFRKEGLIDELHWKAIRHLITSYDLILYGDIKSHDIVKNGFNKKNNRDFNDLKFHKFKTRLLYKCAQAGKIAILVNESYTTKGCSSCGRLKDHGSSEIYKCDGCGFICDRDINSAKNILMKGMLN